MTYTFSSPLGDFKLALESSDPSLRPFDAADEYLLNRVREEFSPAEKILTVNDSQGALSVPLAFRCTALVQDSCRDKAETEANLLRNGCAPLTSTPLLDLERFDADLIIIKVPRSVDFFRFQLQWISCCLESECTVLAGGMNKYLPRAFFEAFKEYCSDASYSRIVKKSRIYCGRLSAVTSTPESAPESSPEPEGEKCFEYGGRSYFSFPGVFSHGKLDGGSRFLLNYISSTEGRKRLKKASGGTAVDPGCGTGVLGLEALRVLGPERVIFSDDSAMAVASTRSNARRQGAGEKCIFLQTNVLEGVEGESADLVICNPPFHRGHSIALDTGFAFIRESARVLKDRGLALFVVNSTLGYGNILNEEFSEVSTVGENRKYRLILCRK